MADNYTKWIARTPPDFWAAILTAMYRWTEYALYPSTWTIQFVADLRGPAIKFSRSLETGNDFHYLAVWDDATWPTPIPQRPWAASDGASLEIQPQQFGPSLGDDEWTDVWTALATAVRTWVVTALVTTNATILDTQLDQGPGKYLNLGTIAIVIDATTATPTYLIWAVQYVGFVVGPPEYYFEVGGARLSPTIAPIMNAQMFGGVLTQIADSAETIAMRDESLTINQNGPIWSAKGRMTTG